MRGPRSPCAGRSGDKMLSVLSRGVLLILGLFLVRMNPALAQQMISLQSGLIDYVKGDVFLNDAERLANSQVPASIGSGTRLSTKDGQAELVLAPNTYLWLGENSSLHMDRCEFNNVRLMLEKGSLMIEIVERTKASRLQVQIAGGHAELRKEGVYRIDAAARTLLVYKGDAAAESGNSKIDIGSGKSVILQDRLVATRFDRKKMDRLHNWAAARSLDLFMRSRETRNQTNWEHIGAGWLWSSGFQTKILSENYAFILLLERERAARESTKRQKQLPCIPGKSATLSGEMSQRICF